MNLRTHWITVGGLFALWGVSAGCQTASQATSTHYCPNCQQYHATTISTGDSVLPKLAPASEGAPRVFRPVNHTRAPELLPAPAAEASITPEREAEAIQVQWTSESR